MKFALKTLDLLGVLEIVPTVFIYNKTVFITYFNIMSNSLKKILASTMAFVVVASSSIS